MCRAMLHASCLTISCDCAQTGHVTGSTPSPTLEVSPLQEESLSQLPESEPSQDEEEGDETRPSLRKSNQAPGNGRSTRRYKRDAALKDQQSTGRKRAAVLYPLDREAPCEWQGYSNCGGGSKPIVGCVSGLQEARHHGPDKSTSNNEPGNVHRICHRCHNRWHAANNKTYDWNVTTVHPHNPKTQTEQEKGQAVLDELVYKGSKTKPIRD